MKVSGRYFSHPSKKYIDHVRRIAESFSERDHKTVALFHDLGKLSDAFQYYITLQKEDGESVAAFEKRRAKFRTTHTLESAYLYFCNSEEKKNTFLANFFAILKHHSSLGDLKKECNDYLSVIDNKGLDQKRLEKISEIADRSELFIDENIYTFIDFFEDLYDEDFYKTIENFFLFKKRYSRLILADKFEAIFSKSYENIPVLSNHRTDRYLQAIDETIRQKQQASPNPYRTGAREAIFRNFEKASDTNIYLIKAPTGIGKTFIALELALKIAKKRGTKRRIITAIPFTSIIDQTHTVYEDLLGEQVLKYHHLTKYGSGENDELEQFSQKVFLADIWHEHFIVTTFNQLLFTFFSNHNRDNLRLETLRDSVIIIDEVQNIPRVLLQSISAVFDLFAKRYNIDFIIMSATMPHIRDAFEQSVLLSETWFYEEKESRYILSYDETLGDYDALKDRIAKAPGSVLCVVNTIEKAKKLHKAIHSEACYLLTTHQTPQHRKEIIDEIKEKLQENRPVRLIATQLIEAGVDLDFDVGFREFAPFGSIIQMAGRVNREGHKGVCNVVVFDYLEGKKAPYHAIDLQEEKIKELLKDPLEENRLLQNLDRYFVDIKYETNDIMLQKKMKDLEFATLFKDFNDNFMPQQPWKVSLFIEQVEGDFDTFIAKRENIITGAKNPFNAKDKIRDLEKDLGLYTISVSQNLINELIARKHPVREMFGRYILPFSSTYYTKERGFDLELTVIEESFS